MLSDEEKEAINQLKADTSFYDYELKNGNYIYELFKIEVYKKDVDVVLNLIEKQSKEIEELKREKVKRSWVHIKENGEVEPLFYVSKEKIKAKIEELDKEEKEELKGTKRSVLQSLLEKE